jgi:hypothetical protein
MPSLMSDHDLLGKSIREGGRGQMQVREDLVVSRQIALSPLQHAPTKFAIFSRRVRTSDTWRSSSSRGHRPRVGTIRQVPQYFPWLMRLS